MAESPRVAPNGEQQRVEEVQAHTQRLSRANRIALAEVIAWSLVACLPLVSALLRLGFSPALVLLAPVAYHHELGRRQLRALDSGAPSHLALDELAVFLFVGAYGAWSVHAAWPDPQRDFSAIRHGEMFLEHVHFTGLRRSVALASNGGLLVCSFTVQSLAARFYRSLSPGVAALAAAQQAKPPDESRG